jgi:hypothetical protein
VEITQEEAYQVRLEEKKDMVKNQIARDDLKAFHDQVRVVLSTTEGRDFVARIFERFPITMNAFSDNGSRTSFNLGQQNVTQWLKKQIEEADSYDLYRQMEIEAIERNDKLRQTMDAAFDKIEKEENNNARR